MVMTKDVEQSTMEYGEFLKSKQLSSYGDGISVDLDVLNPHLFKWQAEIVRWALHKGRAALLTDCGTGKSLMQLEWANQVALATGGAVLIFAPLAVSNQTVREGEKFGISVHLCKTQSDVLPGINITNYEKMAHFDPAGFVGLVLDESSLLKSYDGKTRRELNVFTESIPYRLACTATPAPNDLSEIINHAEFLGVMQGKEIIALYFTQDGNTAHKWRLKGHAKQMFWKWLATWSVAVRKPSDLGYDDAGFILPELHKYSEIVDGVTPEGYLFPIEAQTLTDRRNARRASLDTRAARCAEIVNNADPTEPWVIWVNLNTEQRALEKLFGDRALSIYGSLSNEEKEKRMLSWLKQERPILISKPTVSGFGINMQHCHNIVFLGLSDSWEQYYQAIRRCWRFGQQHTVECYVITSESEGAIVSNIERKEQQAQEMMQELVSEMSGLQLDRGKRDTMQYQENIVTDHDWMACLGDSVEMMSVVEDDSVGLIVFSPPFPGMYVYTNSEHDMGNTRNIQEMIAQFKYLIPQLLRVLLPGRSCAIHLTQAVAFKGVDGYMGLKDFRGMVIQAMEEGGFIYYGEVCIDKNPQVKAIRTRDMGLAFKTLAKDSSCMHMAMADYILQFRKPGDNPLPIRAGISTKYNNPDGWITSEEWIEWAAPVWYRYVNTKEDTEFAEMQPNYPSLHMTTPGISETNVLNVKQARETNDERHLAPLQLDVIERCIKLWSAPGDLVLSPFMGIGSEGHVAIKFNRRFWGCELKESYWKSAIKNLKDAVYEKAQPSMFDLFNVQEPQAQEELIAAE